MKQRGTLSRLIRLAIALTSFVSVLALLIYFGFEKKYQSTGIKQIKKNSASMNRQGDTNHLFYKSIGKTTANVNARNLTKRSKISNKYTLEFKVFNQSRAAEEFVDSLNHRGIEAYYTPFQRNGKVIFRVRRGVFSSKQTAEKAAIALRQKSKVNSRVIKLL